MARLAMKDIKAVEEGYKNAGAMVKIAKGDTIEYSTLYGALSNKGMVRVAPRQVSDETALARALEACKLPGTIKASVGRGRWTIHLRWKEGAERLAHRQVMRAKIVNGEPSITFEEGSTVDPELRARIISAWTVALGQLTNADMGNWWRKTCQDVLDGVAVDGGWWYIPQPQKLLLNQLKAAVETTGHQVRTIPVTHSNDLIKEALEGLENEAHEALAEIEKILASQDETKLTERNLQVRKARVEILDQLKAKIDRYHAIFKVPMGNLDTRVMDLKLRVAKTFFRTEAVERGQDVGEGQRVLELDDRTAVNEPVEWESERGRVLELDDDRKVGGDLEDEDKVRKLDIDE